MKLDGPITVGGGSAEMNITALLNAILNFVLGLLRLEIPEIFDILGGAEADA